VDAPASDPTGQPDPPPATAPADQPVPALCADGRRALIAIAVSVVVPTLLSQLLQIWMPELDGPAQTVVLLLFGWDLFVVVYLTLTARVFRSVPSDEFRRRIAARAGRRSRPVQRFNPRGDGPTFAVEAAVVAFAVVLAVPHFNAISIDDWLLVPITLSTLLSSWALSVGAYSLHYAEHDIAAPGLDFPGERTNAYADYLYFSLAVATTFGATDVDITTPAMRRVVNLHSLLTFIYNSVIVALLASLLLR
jgi:uncharacterized membrane protein